MLFLPMRPLLASLVARLEWCRQLEPGVFFDAGRHPEAGREGPLKIAVDSSHSVSALLQLPDHAKACFVMAHGAGAGMTHPFMTAVSDALFTRGIATLRYQFPSMEAGSKRPDRPVLAQATVRAAVAEASRVAPSLPLFAGGKSFGGRMTSQAQAAAPLPSVRGLVFLGFPLHPADKPSVERAEHLNHVQVPMFFLQGTRDSLADMDLVVPLVSRLGAKAALWTVEQGDHSFKVPARSGTSSAEALANALDALTAWIDHVVAG